MLRSLIYILKTFPLQELEATTFSMTHPLTTLLSRTKDVPGMYFKYSLSTVVVLKPQK